MFNRFRGRVAKDIGKWQRIPLRPEAGALQVNALNGELSICAIEQNRCAMACQGYA